MIVEFVFLRLVIVVLEEVIFVIEPDKLIKFPELIKELLIVPNIPILLTLILLVLMLTDNRLFVEIFVTVKVVGAVVELLIWDIYTLRISLGNSVAIINICIEIKTRQFHSYKKLNF